MPSSPSLPVQGQGSLLVRDLLLRGPRPEEGARSPAGAREEGDVDGMVKTKLDEALQEILRPFEIRVVRRGDELTCLSCGAKTPYTFGDRCGACYLAGRPPRLN